MHFYLNCGQNYAGLLFRSSILPQQSVGPGSVSLVMLVVKAVLVICFLCVGLSQNWLNADKSKNCEKVDRSIPSFFRLPVLVNIVTFAIQNKFLHN